MRNGYEKAIPHTEVEVSAEDRAEARRRYALLTQIETAVRAGDYEAVKDLATGL